MAKMFIANASLQIQLFSYRMPEQTKQRTLQIEPMSQTAIPDDLLPTDVESIVGQHEMYGFISLTELKNGVNLKHRTSLLYNLDAPIASEFIRTLFNINKGILDEFGQRVRQEAAIATNNVLNNALDAQRHQGLDADVGEVEVTVQEEDTGSVVDRDPIAEGFVVAENQEHGTKTTSRRSGRR